MRHRLPGKAALRAAALVGVLLTLAGCIVAPYPPRYAYHYRPYRYYYPYY